MHSPGENVRIVRACKGLLELGQLRVRERGAIAALLAPIVVGLAVCAQLASRGRSRAAVVLGKVVVAASLVVLVLMVVLVVVHWRRN